MNINWMDFISNTAGNIIGAFVGFFLALMYQRRTDSAKRLERVKKVLLSVTEELEDIRESIEEYLAAEKILRQKISVPAWEAVLNSGILLDLIDNSIYDKLIKVYSSIKCFNESLDTESDVELSELMNEIVNLSKKITTMSKLGDAGHDK